MRYTEIQSTELYRFHRNSTPNFAGNFMHCENKNSDYTIYSLDDFDTELCKNVPLKNDEIIFRCDTDKIRFHAKYLGAYLIKINIKKGLVYFLNEEIDDRIIFNTRGIKMTYFNHYVNHKNNPFQ